jgi:hypothetical protein
MIVDEPLTARGGIVDDVEVDPRGYRLKRGDDGVDRGADRQAEDQDADRLRVGGDAVVAPVAIAFCKAASRGRSSPSGEFERSGST